MSALPLQDVFISYSSADLALVKPIADALVAEGISVWRDKDRILGGQEWNGDIEWAIANSRVLVVMCSPRAFGSKNVRKEVSYAWNSAHGNYVPVWVSPPEEFPVGSGFGLFLGSLHHIQTVGRPQADWLPELLAALAPYRAATECPGPAAVALGGAPPPQLVPPAPAEPQTARKSVAPPSTALPVGAPDPQVVPEADPPVRRRQRVWTAVAGLLALVAVVTTGWTLFGNRPSVGLPDHAPSPPEKRAVPPAGRGPGETRLRPRRRSIGSSHQPFGFKRKRVRTRAPASSSRGMVSRWS